jgi:hypothetical protein
MMALSSEVYVCDERDGVRWRELRKLRNKRNKRNKREKEREEAS